MLFESRLSFENGIVSELSTPRQEMHSTSQNPFTYRVATLLVVKRLFPTAICESHAGQSGRNVS
jgi:hypothetical protein